MDLRDRLKTVGSVVSELPEAAEIFSNYNIDYCCGGNRLLRGVLFEKQIDMNGLYEKLEQVKKNRGESYKGAKNEFNKMSPAELSAYVQDTHHAYLRDALPETRALLHTVLRAHGKNHRELFDIYSLFGRLKSDLEQHLIKEEDLLFPAFSDEDANRQAISTLASDIIKEHEAAGGLLLELRELANDYKPPADACASYEKVYQMLEDLEYDLHQHIHLENNIMLQNYDHRQGMDHNNCEIMN